MRAPDDSASRITAHALADKLGAQKETQDCVCVCHNRWHQISSLGKLPHISRRASAISSSVIPVGASAQRPYRLSPSCLGRISIVTSHPSGNGMPSSTTTTPFPTCPGTVIGSILGWLGSHPKLDRLERSIPLAQPARLFRLRALESRRSTPCRTCPVPMARSHGHNRYRRRFQWSWVYFSSASWRMRWASAGVSSPGVRGA